MSFHNSKIYKIVSDHTGKVYIGSTTQSLEVRFSNHKANYKRWKKAEYNYVSSFEIMKFRDAKIVLVETFPCNTFVELQIREQYWKERTQNCCNKRNAYDPNDKIRELNKNRRKHNCDYCDILCAHFNRHCKSQTHKDNVKIFNKILNH